MNRFEVAFYDWTIDDFKTISGTPIFPLNYADLLDERLDEAYLTILGSKTEHFTPNTEVRITVTDSDRTQEFYYIIASDSAQEKPIGSGLWRHELYLIELTKRLEGIICQTLTFTNSLGASYTFDNPLVVTAT